MSNFRVDFNKLEENMHLMLYYLYKIFPERATKQDLAMITSLSDNAVYNKIKTLSGMGLIETKKRGRSPGYFLNNTSKELIEEWVVTETGKGMVKGFDEIINEKTSSQ